MEFQRKFAGNGLLLLCGVGALLATGTAGANQAATSLRQRRIEVLAAGQKGAAGLPVLTAAMKDSNAMLRRAAVRSMEQIGIPAESALSDALKNDADALVRRTALYALFALKRAQPLPVLELAMGDSSALVRASSVSLLAGIQPQTPEIMALLQRAQQDKSADVSQVAAQALWPAALQKDGVSLREKPEFKDQQLTVAQSIPLPENDWRFQTDAGQVGQSQNWFATDFDAGQWKSISITKAWETQIGEPYDGAAWYRTTFTLPAKPAQVGTDLVFDAVDESAWIWINGQFVGQHDIGPDGWDQRFAMDVSDYLKWGETNQITVRVLDRMHAGGIWKPVYLEVLKK